MADEGNLGDIPAIADRGRLIIAAFPGGRDFDDGCLARTVRLDQRQRGAIDLWRNDVGRDAVQNGGGCLGRHNVAAGLIEGGRFLQTGFAVFQQAGGFDGLSNLISHGPQSDQLIFSPLTILVILDGQGAQYLAAQCDWHADYRLSIIGDWPRLLGANDLLDLRQKCGIKRFGIEPAVFLL